MKSGRRLVLQLGSVAVAWILALGSPLLAQDPDYVLNISSGAGDVDDTVTVLVDMDNLEQVDGWSCGVCHDEDLLSIEIEDIVEGALFDEYTMDFSVIDDVAGGWNAGVVVSLFGDGVLAGTGQELYNVTYTLVQVGTSDLEFCSSLGSPPVEVLLILEGGGSVVPTVTNGEIEIGVFHFDAVDTFAVPGETIDVPILLDVDIAEDIRGFQFGLLHDPDLVEVAAFEPGADLLDLNDGDGPSLFLCATPDPDNDDTDCSGPVEGGVGITVGVVFNVAAVEVLAGPGTFEVSVVSYLVSEDAEADVDIVPLDFDEDLFTGTGDLTVLTVLDVDSLSRDASGRDGTITVVPVKFLRGDTNGSGAIDVADAIFLLDILGDVNSTDCPDALDIDDSGTISIVDPLRLLLVLFRDGYDDPPPPFDECGIDTTDGDDLECTDTFEGCAP